MDDLISRQEAIDALDGEIIVTGRANAEAVRGYANLISDRIKRLPSAQPKKGKWIDETFKPNGLAWYPYRCNQCGCHNDYASMYCPDCGAYMMEGGKENDHCRVDNCDM